MANALAFSTLGCPEWNLDRILQAAVEYGYDAVELRGYRQEIDLPLAEPFTPANRAATRARFADAGVAVCCVSSSGVVTKGNTDHVRAHAELARDLGAPYVRVFGGALGEEPDAWQQAAANLHSFGEIAREAGVEIVLETHDSFSTGQRVAELIAAADHPSVRSLWDLHHPYRMGEAIATTYQALAPTVAHVHIKDSIPGGAYCLPGEGDVPMTAMLDLLLGGGYTGAISLEWEKRWHPEIPEPESAFPAYLGMIKTYLARVSR